VTMPPKGRRIYDGLWVPFRAEWPVPASTASGGTGSLSTRPADRWSLLIESGPIGDGADLARRKAHRTEL